MIMPILHRSGRAELAHAAVAGGRGTGEDVPHKLSERRNQERKIKKRNERSRKSSTNCP